MKPLVSVILPTYNRVDTLRGAMDSVKRQVFTNWELLVIDDYSTDNTRQVISSWAMTDNRIKVLWTHQQTGSPVLPRNLGCRNARGKYLAFLDSDDQWDVEKLATQAGYLEVTGEAFSYHNLLVKYIDTGESEIWSKMSTCHSGNVFPFLLKKNFIPTSSVLLRKDVYDKYGPMDISLDISHDWDLWLKIAFDYQLHYIPDIIAGKLTVHHGSVISKVHNRRRESRDVIRKWVDYVDGDWYKKIMIYYYLMEAFDLLPKWVQMKLRRKWYEQDRYK